MTLIMTQKTVPDKEWDGWKNEYEKYYDLNIRTGDYLVAVFKCKLQNWHNPLDAITTIYGIDEEPDNVSRLRKRLLDFLPLDMHDKANEILDVNIGCSSVKDWDEDEWCPNNESKTKGLEDTGWFKFNKL